MLKRSASSLRSLRAEAVQSAGSNRASTFRWRAAARCDCRDRAPTRSERPACRPTRYPDSDRPRLRRAHLRLHLKPAAASPHVKEASRPRAARGTRTAPAADRDACNGCCSRRAARSYAGSGPPSAGSHCARTLDGLCAGAAGKAAAAVAAAAAA